MKWMAFLFTTSMHCNQSPNNHLLCAARCDHRGACGRFSRVLCWREFAVGERSLKVAPCLVALDVREHFDNYLPPLAPPTDAVRDARLSSSIELMGFWMQPTIWLRVR